MENKLLEAADELYLYALKCSEIMWDNGLYTKGAYLNEKARAYKAIRKTFENSDLNS